MPNTPPTATALAYKGRAALRVQRPTVRPGTALTLPDGSRCVAGRTLWSGERACIVARGRATQSAARARARVAGKRGVVRALDTACITRITSGGVHVLRKANGRALRVFANASHSGRAGALVAARAYIARIDADHARRALIDETTTFRSTTRIAAPVSVAE